MKKSITQMTKLELLDEIHRLRSVVADLNQRITELETMAVASASHPLDGDTSAIIQSLSARIKQLEEKHD